MHLLLQISVRCLEETNFLHNFFIVIENWGPHLIIVPTSVMLNWEMEFKKWCPAFKILTYYGNPKERKLKRAGLCSYLFPVFQLFSSVL